MADRVAAALAQIPIDQPSSPDEDFTARLRQRFGNPPPAVRAFVDLLGGDRSKMTESSFTPGELQILRETVEKQLAKGKNVIGYGDYGQGDDWEKSFGTRLPPTPENPYGSQKWPSGTEAVMHALTDPRSSLAFTLGMARAGRQPDGTLVINDRYDFAANKKQVDDLKGQGWPSIFGMGMRGLVSNGLLGLGNVIGNLAAPEGGGREVEIRIPPRTP